MNDANDFVVVINNREVGEAGLIKFVEGKWAEYVFGINKNEVVFWNHKIGDFAIIETHDGRNATAVFGAEDIFGSAAENIDELF